MNATDLIRHVACNARLVADVDALDNVFAGPFPQDTRALANARWNVTRDLLLYFAKQDSIAVQPLKRDARPAAVAAGARADRRFQALRAMFDSQNATRFAQPTAAQWPLVQSAVRGNLAQVRAALTQDRAELFNFLPPQCDESVPIKSPIASATLAWQFRDELFRPVP